MLQLAAFIFNIYLIKERAVIDKTLAVIGYVIRQKPMQLLTLTMKLLCNIPLMTSNLNSNAFDIR